MKVWLVFESVPWEADVLLKIFSTPEAAEEYVAELGPDMPREELLIVEDSVD